MPLFPAFLQLVLKAEGIRPNPNRHSHPSLGSSPTSRGWSSSACSGEQRKNKEAGRRRWGTVCRTWLFRSVDPIRRVVTCLVWGHVPPECREGGVRLGEGEECYYCLIWSHSVCISGVVCYMKSACAFFFSKWSAYLCSILSNVLFVCIDC